MAGRPPFSRSWSINRWWPLDRDRRGALLAAWTSVDRLPSSCCLRWLIGPGGYGSGAPSFAHPGGPQGHAPPGRSAFSWGGRSTNIRGGAFSEPRRPLRSQRLTANPHKSWSPSHRKRRPDDQGRWRVGGVVWMLGGCAPGVVVGWPRSVRSVGGRPRLWQVGGGVGVGLLGRVVRVLGEGCWCWWLGWSGW